MKLPIALIKIGVRQRLELGDLTDLDSMSDPQVGQIQPIVVRRLEDATYELVAGRRRLAKATELKWPEVDVWVKDDMTNKQKELAEFFEDFARKDRTWQENCLATYNLFHMLRFEKREEGQTWTIRSMEKFCGRSRNEVHYRLKVAEALLVEPKDQELWEQDGITNAQKLLISRANKATTAEKERRRLANAQAQAVTSAVPGPIVPEVEEEPVNLEDPAFPSVVPTGDPTPKPIKIKLLGRNSAFTGQEKGFFAALMFQTGEAELTFALNAMNKGSFVVGFDCLAEPVYGTPLYWNRVKQKPWLYPFYAAVTTGFVAASEMPVESVPSHSGCFTAMDFSDGTELSGQIVGIILNRLTTPDQSVLCLGGINPNDVVDAGRIPVWYEPDAEKYAAKLENLKENYRAMYENVEFEE